MVACNGWSIASMVLSNQVHVKSSIVSVHTTALVLLARHPFELTEAEEERQALHPQAAQA